ncbi:hypothetical protein ACFRAO_10005 [Streptomyces sp. NPDC056656]|uniref:hypothetical protein n=1 Tax=Streptomyces sp. NPDC056656 TaxID=3345895 RepID=UPI0036894BD6
MIEPSDENFILSSRELSAIELDILMEGSQAEAKKILDLHELSEDSLPHHHPGLAESIQSLPEDLQSPVQGDEDRSEDWPDAPSRGI